MKVNNNIGSSLTGIEAKKAEQSTRKGDKGGITDSLDPKSLKDASKVNVSEQARAFNKAKEIAMQANDVDHEKVARLQKLIDSGDYKVDAGAVADRLIAEHSQFND
ncbi:MAG: flagellar biosynthesis anti-sigma factor FlgM [Pseudobdellovibrionaceae bacterium]|nr:flagellar biosynthesis anti-sigma factor FlgM [Bdellovibrionales bacterium]USN46482.1 MAG: flagellar biosynthesis anti-sigma factor FlgM [Pseudobdellovibrionaceae bacterium]